jgi:hypothetical protein
VIRGDGRLGRLLGLAVLTLALAGFAGMMVGSVPTAREALLRYVLGALIVLAVAPAHMLLPDPLVSWLQRLNPSPVRLLGRGGGRWAGAVLASIAPVVVIVFQTGAWAAGAEALLLLLGVAMYAFQNTMSLGPVSQEWQEGRRGTLYRNLVARDPRVSLQVPHGMVPAMLASMRIFLIGFAFVMATIIVLSVAGPAAGWLPGTVLLAWSGWKLVRLSPMFDRAYYHTSALYAELLHSPSFRLGARPALGFDAVYWVPSRWRPYAWAGLVQLDRRLPLGRLVALGTLAFWALFALDISSGVIAIYLAGGLLVRNATILRHAQADLAPPQFHLAFQSPFDWAITRFWMNVRWTLPLVLALGITAIFSRVFTWEDVVFWAGVDLGLAALTAIIGTYVAEQRYRRRFA